MTSRLDSVRHRLVLRSLLIAAATLAAGFVALPAHTATLTSLEFLGRAEVEIASGLDARLVGGLSGLAYDASTGRYLAISDDASRLAPARLVELEIELEDGRLGPGGARAVGFVELEDVDGRPFARDAIDGEGIAIDADGSLWISSEGFARNEIAPFVRRFSRAGKSLEELSVPPYYDPVRGAGGESRAGIRHNLGFEGLTLDPDGRSLWSVTENALAGDGPAASPDAPSPSRLLRFDLERGALVAEHVLWTEPVAEPSRTGGIEVAGVVELLALGDDRLLALERSYSAGGETAVRLFELDVAGADRVSGARIDAAAARPVAKRPVLDLRQLGFALDNLEGLAFGPPLADGRRLLLLVSDDNFAADQVTQVLAFAAGLGALDISAIQGAGHRSPFEGRWVREVRGVVTAIEPAARPPLEPGIEEAPAPPAFWLQSLDPDGDPATSDALRVRFAPSYAAREPVRVGDVLRVAGRVDETARPGELPITGVEATELVLETRDNPLPAPVILGEGGRMPPDVLFEGDGFASFRPEVDGLDFFESLEGMRVTVREPLVVGPTDGYAGLAVVGDDGRHAGPRSRRGGLVLRPEDANPERILVDTLLLRAAADAGSGAAYTGVEGDDAVAAEPVPDLAVGDRLEAPIVGVLGYRFGDWRLYATEPIPSRDAESEPFAADATALRGDDEHLTVATYNVLNLDALDPPERFAAVARSIVDDLGAPDLVGLQEVQDDDGPLDEGVVSAERTLARLIEAIVAAGGPRYAARQIDPVDGAEGGQPGGNIRNAYLFDPVRVAFVDRGAAGPLDATRVVATGAGPRLSLSPGRIAPEHPAFAEDEATGFEGSRRPLAAELLFGDRRLFVINNHWKSKRGDDRLGGARQPPERPSEVQRTAQARVVADFVDEILALDPRAAVIVLGDLNEHEFRSPLAVLAESGLINPLALVPEDDRYTYNYLGNSQTLDHVLLSPALAEAGAEVDVVHVNADLPAALAASDHDPVLVRLRLAD